MTRKMMWLGLLLLLAVGSRADTTFSWSGPVAIPDNDASGVAYAFNVSEPGMFVSGVTVALSISGGWNGDLYAYLSSGAGFAVLLNRVGVGVAGESPLGYGVSGLNVTLASGLISDVHSYSTPSGLWGADGRNIDPASSAGTFAGAARDHTLDVFTGMDPMGDWTLFLADCSDGSISTLNSWSVTVQTVPEPGSLGLLITGVATLGGLAARNRRRRRGEVC